VARINAGTRDEYMQTSKTLDGMANELEDGDAVAVYQLVEVRMFKRSLTLEPGKRKRVKR
jgi:hypothetical protein